ncbi:MAG: chloride channel protein [Verrucomicrobiae bacterium]|nr:chloride channel protein [Verrucomicrobiae bacterium]
MGLAIETLQRFKSRLRSVVSKNIRTLFTLRERLATRAEFYHLSLGAIVGLCGGFANLLFHLCEEVLKFGLLKHHGEITEIAEVLPWWQRLIAPVFGSILASIVLVYGIKRLAKSGPSNFLEAIVAGDGRLPFIPGVFRTLSSLLSLASGLSIGREGSIVHFSSTVASKFGQLLDAQPYTLRLVTACGAASGFAAAFNAPLAGAVFAAQIVIGNFSMNMFAPILLSSVMGSMVSRSFFGIKPLYDVPAFDFTRIGQLPWLFLVGIGCGVIGAIFLKGLDYGEKYFRKAVDNLTLRMGLGGLLVGAIAIVYPWVWGNGYGAINKILSADVDVHFLLGIFAAKILATIISVGSGAVGGIMTPTLFAGAAYGSFCGLGLHALGFAKELPICVFALSGMAGVFSATVHSPLLAMLMIFEISLNYSLMPALMLVCPLATLVGRRLHRNSVYTKPLAEKGIIISESKKGGAVFIQKVGDIMRKPVPPIFLTTPFQTIIERFLSSSNNFLPVVDEENRLVGIIHLQDVKEFLSQHTNVLGIIAYDIMRPAEHYLLAYQNLIDALPVLLEAEMKNIPVVNNDVEKKLVGAVLKSEALGILSETITASPRRY